MIDETNNEKFQNDNDNKQRCYFIINEKSENIQFINNFDNKNKILKSDNNEDVNKNYEIDYNKIEFKNNGYPWIRWNNNSCRYYAFLTIVALAINKKFDIINPFCFDNEDIILKELQSCMNDMNDKKFSSKMIFWKFLDDNGIDKNIDHNLFGKNIVRKKIY